MPKFLSVQRFFFRFASFNFNELLLISFFSSSSVCCRLGDSFWPKQTMARTAICCSISMASAPALSFNEWISLDFHFNLEACTTSRRITAHTHICAQHSPKCGRQSNSLSIGNMIEFEAFTILVIMYAAHCSTWNLDFKIWTRAYQNCLPIVLWYSRHSWSNLPSNRCRDSIEMWIKAPTTKSYLKFAYCSCILSISSAYFGVSAINKNHAEAQTIQHFVLVRRTRTV